MTTTSDDARAPTHTETGEHDSEIASAKRLLERIVSSLIDLKVVTARSLRKKVQAVSATRDEVQAFLREPGTKPYGRSLLFQSSEVEVIVMNWAPGATCLPHDHGDSMGWVQVLSGRVKHTVFSSSGGTPRLEAQVTTAEEAGALLHAPLGMIHQMGASRSAREQTVTLHFYSPPISGMRVFDLSIGAACVVADDCGAWWPDPGQLVQRVPFPGVPLLAADERRTGKEVTRHD